MAECKYHSRYAPYFTGFTAALFLGLLLNGCGVKAPPKPISPEAAPQIKDLAAKVRAKGVELTWSVPDQPGSESKDGGYSFSVVRADLNWENRDCLDCPELVQKEILHIEAAHPEPAVLQDRQISWVDEAVFVNHAYRYYVFIQDKEGHNLSRSNPVIAKVVTAPPAPKGLTGVTQAQGILLRWKASKKDERGRPLQGELQFVVERLSPNGAWETVSTIPLDGNSFLDSAVASNQIYGYRVSPVLIFEKTTIYGEPAVIQRVKAPAALPPPPPSTVWVIPAKGGLDVHWIESEGRVSGYYVYRREGKEITRLTANPVQRPPYSDHSVKPNVVYFYAVSSVGSQPEQKEGLLSKWTEIKSFLLE